MARKSVHFLSAALVALLAAAPVFAATPSQRASPPLEADAAFSNGVLIADRNHDGVADYIEGALWLGPSPDPRDLAAAATVTARLGYEVTSLDLPLLKDVRGPRVLVGRSAVAAMKRPDLLAIVDQAAPGHGLIFWAGQPSARMLVIAGQDPRGTRAAADFAAAWLPGPGAVSSFESLRRSVLSGMVPTPGARLVIETIDVGADGVGALSATLTGLTPAQAVAAAHRLALTSISSPFPGQWTLRVRMSGGDLDLRLAATDQRVVAASPSTRKSIDLARFYSLDGALGDADGNLIPDRVDVLLAPSAKAAPAIIDLAARLGLETTGYQTGLVVDAARFDPAASDRLDPAALAPLVLIGADHPLVGDLVTKGAYAPPSLQAGEGAITLVNNAFGSSGAARPAVVVAGADAEGLERATAYLARQVPNIADRGEDRPSFEAIGEDLTALLAARSPAGQAARADRELRRLLEPLKASGLQDLRIDVSLADPDPNLRQFIEDRARGLLPQVKTIETRIESRNVEQAHAVSIDGRQIGVDRDMTSERDDFWRMVREQVVPAVRQHPGAPVRLEARLSEPPQVRAELVKAVTEVLVAAGAKPQTLTVQILSAYKQGFSWLDEVVVPQLQGKRVERVEIRFAKLTPPKAWPQQAILTPSRWVNEIYPIDAVMAQKLGVRPENVIFTEAPAQAQAYQVAAFDASGAKVFEGAFDPKVVVRSFFDVFPDYEKVRVTTGWLSARVAEDAIVDQRIETDLERLWDIYQREVLPDVYAHVMALSGGKPRPSDAPFFGELRFMANVSEPDYRLGVGEEVISAVDGINQDFLFFTRLFFQQMGLRTVGTALSFPGQIIPEIRPSAAGETEHVKIAFKAFDAPRAQLNLSWRAADGARGQASADLARLALERPRLTAIVVDKLDVQPQFEVPVSGAVDDLDKQLTRVRLSAVRANAQRTFISADQVAAQIDALTRLRAAGLYRETLSAGGLGEMRIVAVDGRTGERYGETRLPANGRPAALPKLPPCSLHSQNGASIVPTDHAIDPAESEVVIACLAEHKGVRAYRVGKSYLGRDIWSMDVTTPLDGAYISRAKLSTSKPTALISARIHANEVSSTTHVLTLVEQVLKEPAATSRLNKLNLAVQPIYNVDGAAIVAQLQSVSPNLLLHVGRFGALSEELWFANPPDPSLTPDGAVRQKLWSMWWPDVFMDPHGLAAHEWVSPFGEYVGWPMNRNMVIREVWAPRGWHIPDFSYLGGEQYSANRAFSFDLLKAIARGVNADPERKTRNRQMLDRWMRYGSAFDPVAFPVSKAEDILVYFDTLNGASPKDGGSWNITHPDITVWTGATEAADEPARGAWLGKVVGEGLAWDNAITGLLVERAAKPVTTTTWTSGGMLFVTTRDRAPPTSKAN